MVLFDILIQRKPSLDQLRTGLETLNVLKQMNADPESMEKYFISKNLCAKEKMLERIEFGDGSSEKSIDTLKSVLQSFTIEQTNKFLIFTTGMNSIFLPKNFVVKYSNCEAIFASTCSLELNIPKIIGEDFTVLKGALLAVVDSSWQHSFNTY